MGKQNRLVRIGITGGIASGKSLFTQLLRDQGELVLDADEFAREVVQAHSFGEKALWNCFGPTIFQQGIVDRARLRDLILERAENKLLLENLTHRLIQWRASREFLKLERLGKSRAFYDAALIFEKNLEPRFDAVILVAAPRDIQVERLVKRNKLDRGLAEKLVDAQMPLEEKLKRTSLVLHNDSSIEDFRHKAMSLLKNLKHS